MHKPSGSFAGILPVLLAVVAGLLLFVFPVAAILLSLVCALSLAWPARKRVAAQRLRLP
jgi:hypothetical protein